MEPKPNRRDIRKVVVILAGPRTGSSFLFNALASLGRFLAPTGEETPFYRRAGLGVFSGPGYSDAIREPPSGSVLDKAGELLLEDVGVRSAHCVAPEILARDFFRRLELQWPGCLLGLDQEMLRAELNARIGSLPAGFHDWRGLYLSWVLQLEKQGCALSPGLFSAAGPHPTALPLLEEPPYIVPEPRIPLSPELAANLPLLLKTSTNAYRIPFLRALFPRASFRWIVLQRNPAATTSALIDGWLSSAFHSHDLSPHAQLGIRGYSERIPGGDRFWKYDLPPGWENFTRADLADVCAFQWLSAYKAIDADLSGCPDPIRRVRYEDLFPARQGAFLLRELLDFAGAPAQAHTAWEPGEPIAAVEKPRPGKWKKREALIRNLLEGFDSGALRTSANRMGYDPQEMELWP